MRDDKLKTAYAELQREFRKNREALKKLESEAEALKKESASRGGDSGVRAISDAEKDAVVEEYLRGLRRAAPALIGGEGYSAALPPRRPKSLSEAKTLADDYLKR